MANTFKGNITVISDYKFTGDADIGVTQHLVNLSDLTSFADGESINQAEVLWTDTRTITASSSEDLDLSGTALQDQLGANIAFTSIKLMYIKALSTNTNDVVVGGASATQFVAWVGDSTDKVNIVPGGTLLIIAPDAAGYAVAAGSTDLLKIANSSSGTSVTYDITLIGTE